MQIDGTKVIHIKLNDEQAMVLAGAVLQAESDYKKNRLPGHIAPSAVAMAQAIKTHVEDIHDCVA